MSLNELSNYWETFGMLYSSVEEVKDSVLILHLALPSWEFLRKTKKSVYAPFKCEEWKVIIW